MKLGFIGTGKITSSVVTGICGSKISYKKIYLSPRNKEIAKKLKKKYRKILIAKNNQEVINSSDWIFLGITPNVGNKIIKFVLGIKVDEFTTSYRGFNLNKLKNFDMNDVVSKGYSFFMETVFLVSLTKNEIKQIPIHFKDRKKGKSKIPTIESFRTLKNLFLLKLRNFNKNK